MRAFWCIAVLSVLWTADVDVVSAQSGSDCGVYSLHGVSLGMTPREVRKKIGRKSESRHRDDDATGTALHESYGLGADSLEIEYRGEGSDPSDQTVVAMRVRDAVGSQSLESLARSLEARFGLPTSGGASLASGLHDGPATWVSLRCDLVVIVSRNVPDWWESGGDLINLEVHRLEAGDAILVPLPEGGSVAGGQATGVDPGAGQASLTVPPVRLEETYVPPEYPRAARRLNLEVRVRLEAIVQPDGTVGEVRVLEGSGTKHGFEDAAIAAVKQWRYRPATRNGEPVAAAVVVVVAFR